MKFTLTKVKNLRHAINSSFDYIKNLSGKVCIVVPDKLTVTLEKAMFEKLNIESSFDIEVITLTRLCNKILTELNISYNSISKLGSVLLIKQILNENANNLKLFNSPNFSYNYSDDIYKVLTQFKASKISNDDIVVNNNTLTQLNNKLLDIKLILEQYENKKAGFVDQSDKLNLLSVNLHNSNIVKNTNFVFVGWTDFTEQGYSVLEQLVANSLSINIFCYSQNGNIIYSNEMLNRLTQMAFSCNYPLEISEPNYLDDDLHLFLANNILNTNGTEFNLKNQQITLYNAKNIEEELEFVIRDIRNNVLNGDSYFNFGIAVYQLEKYVDIIKSICEKYEINYYVDYSTNLSTTIYFKFILNLLELYNNNFKLENIMAFINSPFIKLTFEQKLNLNKFLKETNFCGDLKYLKNDSFKEEIAYLQTILNNIKFEKNINLNTFFEQINNLNNLLNIEEKINVLINQADDMNNKKILSQCINSFNNLLTELSKFYSNLTLNDFIDILSSAANEQKIMPIPQSIDCVQIIDANEILTDFNNLYIVNCINSTCPQISQDIGIILDSDINNLPFNKKLSPTINHLNKMSRFKMFNSFQMFNQTLTVTMSCSNESEKSELVKQLKNKIKVNNFPINILNSSDFQLSHKALSKWDLIEFLSKNYSLENTKLLNAYGIESYSHSSHLNADNIKLINFKEISCSALENYHKCPMQYFLSNTIKLVEERKSGIEMVDVGNLLHQLAQDFYKQADRLKLDLIQFCHTKINKYILDDFKLQPYLNSPVHHNLVKEGVRFLTHLLYLDENSSFVPTFFEYSFDSVFNKTIPLTEDVYLRGKIDRIDFANNYVRIIDYKTGNANASLKELYYGKKLQLFLYAKVAEQIFNKEIAGTFYLPIKNSILTDENIVPYKLTGFYKNNNDLAEMFDKNINTTIKSNLLNLSLDKNGDIKTDSRSNKVLTTNKFNTLLDYSVNLSRQAIEQIKQGYIMPNPIKYDDQNNSCNSCKYLPICRKNSFNIKYRTTKNVDLSSFGGENV